MTEQGNIEIQSDNSSQFNVDVTARPISVFTISGWKEI